MTEIVRDVADYEEIGDSTNVGILVFDQTVHDFDTIMEGEYVNHIFEFENRGSEPIHFRDVRSSCGCTVPVWPEKAVEPGERSEIRVRFNSLTRPGRSAQDYSCSYRWNS